MFGWLKKIKTPFKEDVVSCLKHEVKNDIFRCVVCDIVKKPGSTIVWVPDAVRSYDPPWYVKEVTVRQGYNCGYSGWCLQCASKLNHNK